MKKYTLEIVYNDKTGEMISLREKVATKNERIAITASPNAIKQITEANLVEDIILPCPGEVVGET